MRVVWWLMTSVCVLIWISPWFQPHLVSTARVPVDWFSLHIYSNPTFFFRSRSLVCKQKDSQLPSPLVVIRRRLRDLMGICLLPKLHAISAIGTKSIQLYENVGIVTYWRRREQLVLKLFTIYIKRARSLTPE